MLWGGRRHSICCLSTRVHACTIYNSTCKFWVTLSDTRVSSGSTSSHFYHYPKLCSDLPTLYYLLDHLLKVFHFGGQSFPMLESTVVSVNFSIFSISLQSEFQKIFCLIFSYYLDHAYDVKFILELFSILWSILCEVT